MSSFPESVDLDRLIPQSELCDYLHLGLLVVDRDLRVMAWNRWLAERTGLEAQEVIGRRLLEIFPELEDPLRLKYLTGALAGETQVLSPELHPYLVRLPVGPWAGEQAEMRQTARLVPLHEGKDVVGVAVFIEDVTERHLHEQELLTLVKRLEETTRKLAKEEQRFRAIFERTPDALALVSPEGIIELANAGAARLFGKSSGELQGSNLLELATDEHRPLLASALSGAHSQGKGTGPLQARFQTAQGSEVILEVVFQPLSSNGNAGAYLFQGRDITERVRMEAVLRQAEEDFWLSQKAEAVSLLAGGVAHDFNNLLAIILGFADLTLQTMPENDPNRPNLEEIRAAAARASEISGDLLSFTGRRPARRGPVKMAPLLHEALHLIRRSLPAGVELSETVDLSEETIFGDRGQVEQVIVNLCTNAAAALRRQGHGLIEVRAERCTVEQGEDPWQEAVPGDYVCVSVSDNAQPLDEEARQRLFDPYFEPYGKGTGRSLGLAASFGLVRSHGGFLTVSSAPGVGNTIRVFLPLALDQTPPVHKK